METNITIIKDNKQFEIEYIQGTIVKIIGDNLYFMGKLTSSILGQYDIEKKNIKFNNSSYYKTFNGTEINGFNIENFICNKIESAISEDKIKQLEETKDRERHRVAPILDVEKFEVFNIGCDTNLIHHENRSAIKKAIENGAKVYEVLRGERDSSNKYEGQMDSNIPIEYASIEEGKYIAKGYKYVYADLNCISKEEYKKAVEEIECLLKKEEEEKNDHIKQKFKEARETGNSVLISKITVTEEESPLCNDDEGDLVDICKMAMPNGTIQEQYFHNY